MKKELAFKLSESIRCHYSDAAKSISEVIDANELILKAPSYEQQEYRIKLKQGHLQAMMSVQKQMPASLLEAQNKDAKVSKKVSNEDAAGIVDLLFMSEIDMTDYMKTFEGLLLSGVCLVSNKISLTREILKQIPLKDIERMLGEYLANFIM